MELHMGRTIYFVFRGLCRGLRHVVHDGVFYDVGYSMVYTMERDGICDDAMVFPIACRMLMGCPIGCPGEYPTNGTLRVQL